MGAKNHHKIINDGDFDYLSFGSGEEVLIMLPGVGDGFKTAKGMAFFFSVAYKIFGKHYKVYAISRRNNIPEGFTIADMAEDVNTIMEAEGIESAIVFGVSQGGMISQELAINHPDKVKKLVLAVTAPKSNAILEEAVTGWLAMADKEDYKGIMLDCADRSYTGDYLQKARKLNAIIAAVKPKSFRRFRILCQSCLAHDATENLFKITCPTFIVGADEDATLGVEGSKELAEKIPNSELYIYHGYSHGVYEQAKDFNERILDWIKK